MSSLPSAYQDLYQRSYLFDTFSDVGGRRQKKLLFLSLAPLADIGPGSPFDLSNQLPATSGGRLTRDKRLADDYASNLTKLSLEQAVRT